MKNESSEVKALRMEYKAYMQSIGYAKTTANTTANIVFTFWNKQGKEQLWAAIDSSDNTLRDIMYRYVEENYPNQVAYRSGYLTSMQYFRRFLKSRGESIITAQPNFIGTTSFPSVHKTLTSKKQTLSPLTLTSEMLEKEHQIVLHDPGYGTDYALIDTVLKRFPENTTPELVAMKIALIDMTNSTNLSRHRQKILVTELADIIVRTCDFDTRLRQGDPSLVPLLAKNNGKINLFSFASKYCTYHAVDVYGNDDYVIFDNVVKNALPKYVAGLHVSTIEGWRKSFDYLAYKACIDELLDANNIHIPFRHRKLDHYLWHTYR